MNDTIGTLEASQRWGRSQTTISKWCREGRIPRATQDKPRSPWHIPDDAVCPEPRTTKEETK